MKAAEAGVCSSKVRRHSAAAAAGDRWRQGAGQLRNGRPLVNGAPMSPSESPSSSMAVEPPRRCTAAGDVADRKAHLHAHWKSNAQPCSAAPSAPFSNLRARLHR